MFPSIHERKPTNPDPKDLAHTALKFPSRCRGSVERRKSIFRGFHHAGNIQVLRTVAVRRLCMIYLQWCRIIRIPEKIEHVLAMHVPCT